MQTIVGKDTFYFDMKFIYENGYSLTSDISRTGKALAHYELYKKIINLPGSIIECGVFKGASFLRFATYRELLESPVSRKIIGFDTFGKFPETNYEPDKKPLQAFIGSAGDESISCCELDKVMKVKGIGNYELVKGDICTTVPEYVNANPQLKIALLHIDTDIYEPVCTILDEMYDRVCRGGVIAFDDYGVFPGETKAVDQFFVDKNVKLHKFPFSHIPAFIIKNN